MRYFLIAGVLGFSFWVLSEAFEIYAGGHTDVVYYLTSLYHVLAGFGLWGLHKTQTRSSANALSCLSAAIVFISYLGLAYFPIQIMNSGLRVPDFLNVNPIYKVLGVFWFSGMIMFGVSILKTNYFPAWTGIFVILGPIVFTATPILNWPGTLAKITNIILSITIIYMCIISYRVFNSSTS